MNDPGLEEPIGRVGRRVDNVLGDDEFPDQFDGTEEEEEKLYLDPSRWWLAATAFPLIAGTFGPMANAFNICALGQYWREEYATDQDKGTYLRDPAWLLTVNAVSLVLGLTGNMSLLLNMTGKASFNIAQPITVSGFFGASVLLIAIVVRAATDQSFHPHNTPGRALTQAFYYATFAAGVYFIVACLMLVTIVGALLKKYDQRFNITPSQRTLMLQTISFMGYLMIGALIFHTVEGWDYLDAVYWANFTLLTVGLGSPFVPETHTGRSLWFLYAIGGIVAIGLVIGSIRSMVIEQGKQKLLARLTEKRREQVSKRALRSVESNLDVWKQLNPRDIRRLEFDAMREIQRQVVSKGKWRALFLSLLSVAGLWFIGALVFTYTEYEQDWSYFEAVYFAAVVLTTVGYGDLAPASNSGKSFFVFWTLLAVPTLTIFISDMGETVVKAVDMATDFIGLITILPGEHNPWKMVMSFRDKKYVSAISHLISTNPDKILLALGQNAEIKGMASDATKSSNDYVSEILKTRLSDEERHHCLGLLDSDEHHQHVKDCHFFRWLLSREITKVQDDIERDKQKQYTYDEWVYFLALLGHDEQSADPLHHRPPIFRPKRSTTGYELGKIVDRSGNIRNWSWLGIRSPLMSAKTESEWILHQLMTKLHRELHPRSLLHPTKTLESPPVTLQHLQ